MKLKPIALAIPMVLAAGSLSAAEIYNKDSNSVELSGWVKAFGNVRDVDQKNIPADKQVKDSDFHVKTDSAISIKGTHEIDDVSKVTGAFSIEADDSTTAGNASFGDITFGYEHTELGDISIGDTGNSFGAVEKANAGEGNNLYAIGQGGVDGSGIRYKKSFGDFNFSANYETHSETNDDSNYALSGEYKVEDSFSAAVVYGSDGDDANSFGLAGDVHFGDLRLGAAFISFEDAGSLTVNEGTELKLDAPNDGEAYSVVAEYKMDDVTIYASYQLVDADAQGLDVDAETMYLGADYAFTSSIKTYLVVQDGSVERGNQEIEATNIKFGAKYSF